ncbi:MAG: hypothetical protein CMG09_05755 [Candidatus Marinimicrobia bacterium]|nr:hypothetical protein [Candidatus Neomarinimicrobiota bacterium]|tara:strand:- start:1581 stop:2816 length:1236 start_codon:yes stop_codon:yes gene_type:complete
MKKHFNILLLLLSVLFGIEDCDIIIEDVREFNRIQKKDEDNKVKLSKEEYLERIDDYNLLLSQVYNSTCSPYRQDSINVNLKFSYGTFTVKRSGDITSYKKILSSSLWLIKERVQKNLRLFIRGKEPIPSNYITGADLVSGSSGKSLTTEMKKTVQEYNALFDNYYNQINEEFENLNKLYKDLNIYIQGPNIFNEMQQIYTIDNNMMYLTIEPPPIYYKKDKYSKKYAGQLKRMDYLRKETFPLKLNMHNEEKGFYMTIPMVPVIQEKRKIDPEYTYAVNLNGTKKIRFEFSKMKIENIILNLDDINGIAVSEVPYNWSKISLSSNFLWSYNNIQTGTQVATYTNQGGVQISPGFENEFIALKKDNEFIIYQRKNVEQSNYSLVLNQNEKNFPSWAKYLLFITLFGGGYAQ